MELKPGYKQTEMGVIPEDWDTQPLGKLAVVERGKFSARPRNDPRFFGGDIPFIQTGDVTNSDGRIKSFSQTLNSQGLAVSKSFPINTLFFTIAANIGDVGICSFATACPDSLVAITPKAKIDKEWIFHYLRRQKKKFESLATHNTQLNINLEKLNPFVLSVPPLPEQRAIASALSDIDALLSSLDRLLAKKRDIKQAVMQRLLTGKQRLSGFSEEWEVKRLGDVVDIRKGQLITETNAVDGSVPVIAGGKKPSYFHDKANRTGRTITISGSGANAGYIAFHDRPIFASDCSTISEGKGYSVEFIFHQLQLSQNAIYKSQTGGAQPHIHPTDLRPIQIGCPSRAEQTAIAAVLSDLDAEVDTLQRRRDKTRAIKQGMMQELLTGRTRLV